MRGGEFGVWSFSLLRFATAGRGVWSSEFSPSLCYGGQRSLEFGVSVTFYE